MEQSQEINKEIIWELNREINGKTLGNINREQIWEIIKAINKEINAEIHGDMQQ